MPREKVSEALIAKIYRRKYEDLGLFFYVEGQRGIMPAISVEKAMYNYYRFICNEEFNIESSMTTYMRMKKEYYESAKTHN